MVDFPVVPRKLALLNVDLQNVFVEGSPIAAPDGLAVVDRVNRLSDACRRAGVLVVHTAHVTCPAGSNVGVMGEIIAPVREGIISRGSSSAALHPHGSRCWPVTLCSRSRDSVPFTAPISS
jgi:nicotinamidase-related amidase